MVATSGCCFVLLLLYHCQVQYQPSTYPYPPWISCRVNIVDRYCQNIILLYLLAFMCVLHHS